MKKTICIFSAQFLPHMGGVERYTYNMAKECVKRGHKVIVVSSLMTGQKKVEKKEGMLIYRLPTLSLMEGRLPVLKITPRTIQMMNHLKRQSIDIVIVNTRFYLLSVYGMRFAYRQNIPLMTIEHGSNYLTFNHSILDRVERLYEHGITRLGKKYCQHYFGVSQACLKWLETFQIQGEGVLYNSIDPNQLPEVAGNRLTIPKDGTILTFTGRLVKEKGIQQLVEAFLNVQQEVPSLYLVVVGDGPLLSLQEEYHHSHIYFTGRKSNEEVLAILEETDIFCLPSESEGFSTSILEAVAKHCLVITTDRGGGKELLPSDAYGLVLLDNQVERIEQALKKAMSPAYRQEATALAYKRLLTHFTWKSCVDQLEKIMEDQLL